MRSAALAAMTMFASTAAAQPADDQVHESGTRPQQAKETFDRGVTAYQRKDYAAAATSFQASYALDARRDVLWAWAQTERLRGNCVDAVALYERYLRQDPPEREAAVARTQLARCQEIVRLPWYEDTLGDVATVAGVSAIAVGTTYLVMSFSDEHARDAAIDRPTYDRLTKDARTERTISIVGFSAGAALVTLGVLHYVSRGTVRESPRVSVAPTVNGFVVAGSY